MAEFSFCLWTHLGQNILVLNLDPKSTVSACLEEISSRMNSFYREDHPPAQLELFKLMKKVKTTQYKDYPTLLGNNIRRVAKLMDPTEKISNLLRHDFDVHPKERVLHALICVCPYREPQFGTENGLRSVLTRDLEVRFTTPARSPSPELGNIDGRTGPSRVPRRLSVTGSRPAASYSSEDEDTGGNDQEHQSSSVSESLDGYNTKDLADSDHLDGESRAIVAERSAHVDRVVDLPIGARIQLQKGCEVKIIEIRRSPCAHCREADVPCQTICSTHRVSPREACLRCAVASRVCHRSDTSSNTSESVDVLDENDGDSEKISFPASLQGLPHRRKSVVNASNFDIGVGNPVGTMVRIAHGRVLRIIKRRKVPCLTCRGKAPCYDVQTEGGTNVETECYTCARQKKSCPRSRSHSHSRSRRMRSSRSLSPRANPSGERGRAVSAKPMTRGRSAASASRTPVAHRDRRHGRSHTARQAIDSDLHATESRYAPYSPASGSKKRAPSPSLGESESVGSKISDSLDSTTSATVQVHGQHRRIERGARHPVPCSQCKDASVGGCYAVKTSNRKACFRCTRQRTACSLVQTYKLKQQRASGSRIEVLRK